MRVPDDVKECVVFLCVRVTDNGVDRFRYGGTAFFVSIPLEVDQETSFVYLVTAKHNIVRSEDYGGLYARLNNSDGQATIFRLNVDWQYPENDAVDIAIVGFHAPAGFQFKHIPLRAFATDTVIEEERIGIGDELLVSGLFTQRFGTQRNLPIVRTGIIASMPDEPLEDTATGLPYNAYLAEVRSIGGLSGSPVFVILEPGRIRDTEVVFQRKIFLLGAIRGHWDYRHRQTVVDFIGDELEYVNMGMAIVTPVQEVLALLNREDFVRARREFEAAFRRDQAPTLD